MSLFRGRSGESIRGLFGNSLLIARTRGSPIQPITVGTSACLRCISCLLLEPQLPVFGLRNALPARVAGGQIVPVLNVLFVLLPAQVDFFATDESWEIDQASIQILDFNLAGLEFVDQVFNLGQHPHGAIDYFTAKIPAVGQPALQLLFRLLQLLANPFELGEPDPNPGEQSASFLAG